MNPYTVAPLDRTDREMKTKKSPNHAHVPLKTRKGPDAIVPLSSMPQAPCLSPKPASQGDEGQTVSPRSWEPQQHCRATGRDVPHPAQLVSGPLQSPHRPSALASSKHTEAPGHPATPSSKLRALLAEVTHLAFSSTWSRGGSSQQSVFASVLSFPAGLCPISFWMIKTTVTTPIAWNTEPHSKNR